MLWRRSQDRLSSQSPKSDTVRVFRQSVLGLYLFNEGLQNHCFCSCGGPQCQLKLNHNGVARAKLRLCHRRTSPTSRKLCMERRFDRFPVPVIGLPGTVDCISTATSHAPRRLRLGNGTLVTMMEAYAGSQHSRKHIFIPSRHVLL